MKYFLILFFIFPSFHYAQNQDSLGVIEGIIIDSKTEEPIPFANVFLLRGSEQIIGTTTDFDGKYVLKDVPAGKYDLQISYVGYQTKKISRTIVSSELNKLKTISLEAGIHISNWGCFWYIIPLFEKDNTTIETTYSRDQIEKMPY